MVQIVLCDRCKLDGTSTVAHFRATFEKLAGDYEADPPIDLCQEHYGAIWEWAITRGKMS